MWEQIRSNRRKSAALVILLAALLFALGYVIGEAIAPGAGIFGLAGALLLWLILCLVAYFQGDNILLAVSGAQEISKADHPQLFNIVEEMQIAAGLPKMPRVYLVNDMALNAFATGRNPDKCAVSVTAGLLGKLNRDQLQGVIAHEMSHILNRDVLLMTMVGVTLGAIVMIADVFLRGLFYSGAGMRSRRYDSEKGGGQGQAIMIVVAIVMAILAPLLAQIIYLAISRRREYLADANGAVLTRYPEGLASALEVLEADTNILQTASKATAPMYIINPLRKPGAFALNLVSTHPPIEERIQILRGMGGGVSFQAYDAAWRTVRHRKSGVIPASALAQDHAQAPRAAAADTGAIDPRQRLRDAGDLLRKVNQFVFLPCTCGLRIKLPPDFKRDKVECPRCHRELTVPVAQAATTQAATPAPDAPLEITRTGNQWMSFQCTCGATLHLSPANLASEVTCSNCGRKIAVRS